MWNMFLKDPNWCCKCSYECKNKFLINKVITEGIRRKKNVHRMKWINYRQTFDCITHTNGEHVSTNYHRTYKTFREYMADSATSPDKRNPKETPKIKAIPVRRRICLGDTLSPSVLGLSITHLSDMRNKSWYGYNCYDKANSPLLYIDDLTQVRCKRNLAGNMTTQKAFIYQINKHDIWFKYVPKKQCKEGHYFLEE